MRAPHADGDKLFVPSGSRPGTSSRPSTGIELSDWDDDSCDENPSDEGLGAALESGSFRDGDDIEALVSEEFIVTRVSRRTGFTGEGFGAFLQFGLEIGPDIQPWSCLREARSPMDSINILTEIHSFPKNRPKLARDSPRIA